MGSQEDESRSMDGSEEDDGSWQLRKKLKAVRPREVRDRDDNFRVVVRFEGDGVKNVDPIKLTNIIKKQVGEVRYAGVLNDGNLLIVCTSEEQAERAGKLQIIGKEKVVRVVRVGTSGSKGVIYGIPLTTQMSELVKNLREKCDAVQSAKRLTRGVEKKATESVLIEFNTKEMPRELYYGFMRYRVREFIHKPMRCFKCQKFGHAAKVCKGQQTCAKCGGAHAYEDCGEDTRPKCCNCGGSHSAAYWGCEVMRRETEIHNVKLKGKISYAEAVKRVDQSRSMGRHRGDAVTVKDHQVERQDSAKEKEVKEREKRDLVIFIAGVINATSEVRSKTERIQIITKAAIQHLGMLGLKWEEVRDGLSVAQLSQEGGAG